MQPIQHASCPDVPPSSAAYLAALIDGQARTDGARADPAHDPGTAQDATGRRDGSTLIWVEGGTADPGGAAGHGRGMIVVACEDGHGAAGHSCVISYPIEAGGQAQRLPAVLALLETLGWSLLASRRKRTASGHANTAVLVNKARPGVEQRLWLAQPVPASREHGRTGKHGWLDAPRADTTPAALRMRRRAQAWTRGGASGGAAT